MKFWKVVFASIVGGLITILLVSLFFSAIIGGFIRSFEPDAPKVKDKTVLQLNANYFIPERSTDGPTPVFSPGGFKVRDAVGLYELIGALHHAADDERVVGLQLELGAGINGYATYEAIRDALKHFKRQGKFIYGYGELLDEKNLYMASMADSIWINPAGLIEFNGLAAQPVFFTKALEKLGIDMQVFYYGKYKSASEPFRLTEMSAANREQVTAYLNSLYDHYLSGLGGDLNLPPEYLDSLANNLAVFLPSDAVEHGLIAATGFKEDVERIIRQRVHGDADNKVPTMTVSKYYQAVKQDITSGYRDDWVAVVFMEGEVAAGTGQDGSIGSSTYRKQLKKLRETDEVKAVVLRLNTPGGLGFASEIIHHELTLFPDSIPIVVSMGDVCASAGYHISSPADHIIAQPNTITGSIGILAVLPNMQELLEDKIGITSDTVKTGTYADFGNIWRPVSEKERAVYQRYIDNGYEDFLHHVATGRNMDSAKVAELAQGRVYTGLQAIDLGLVDQLGGLQDAIAKAADMANLDEYYVRNYPPQKDFFERLDEVISSGSMSKIALEWEGIPYVKTLQTVWRMQHTPGIYYRMPYDLEIK